MSRQNATQLPHSLPWPSGRHRLAEADPEVNETRRLARDPPGEAVLPREPGTLALAPLSRSEVRILRRVEDHHLGGKLRQRGPEPVMVSGIPDLQGDDFRRHEAHVV